MSFRTLTRKPTFLIYSGGVILLLVAGGLWWQKVSTDPQRVFWSTVNQSLMTNSVTVSASQANGATKADQTARYSFGLDESNTYTMLTQGNTKVFDETYGTPSADYTRYVNITTDQKTASGKKMDFSTIKGVWAKSDGTGASASTVVLLAQSVLGTGLPLGGVALPIADLKPNLRTQLVDQIRTQDVYDISYKNVKKTHKNGRLLYTYNATVQPILYASMMKNFAKVAGLHNFDKLDPNSFAGQQDLKLQLTIDVRAHHLINVTAADGQVNQSYGSYDVPVTMPTPTKTITATQLQQRLQQLQK